MFIIERHPAYSNFIISRQGKGLVPSCLSGMFTSQRDAKFALSNYELEAAKADKKKADAEKVHQEALNKPLGHTQKRKPRNAKKPSTSGK